jgi:hypothetical protein
VRLGAARSTDPLRRIAGAAFTPIEEALGGPPFGTPRLLRLSLRGSVDGAAFATVWRGLLAGRYCFQRAAGASGVRSSGESMLKVVFRRVRPDQVERLRSWLRELDRRHEEVRETFRQETVRHEIAYLLEDNAGHVLVYAMEAYDVDKARDAFQASTLPIDLEHKEVMSAVLAGSVAVERLYECALPRGVRKLGPPG